MNISALSNINFKSNTPIYHIYNRDKDGLLSELEQEQFKGPLDSLIKRLNKKNTPEADFFAYYIPDFKKVKKATSTAIGNNEIRKSTIVYGRDAINVNELREDCYVQDCYSKEDINSMIRKYYVLADNKRAISEETGEKLGLILYTTSQGNSFKLDDIHIVNTKCKPVAKFSDEQTLSLEEEMAIDEYLAEKNKKQPEEFPPRPEELEEEFEDIDKYLASFQPAKLVQGELFDKIA
ncbi:MAG: hypothetical protein MJ180_00710 [Candidatus Gastranaerophilales bacterium]|nr:hypothetical protein [Candidatus Gastranaerophilales bacterium]